MVHTDKQVATTSNSEIHWQLDIFTQAVRSAPFNYDRYCKSNKFISWIRSATNNSFKEWYIQLVMCRLRPEAKSQAKKSRAKPSPDASFFWPMARPEVSKSQSRRLKPRLFGLLPRFKTQSYTAKLRFQATIFLPHLSLVFTISICCNRRQCCANRTPLSLQCTSSCICRWDPQRWVVTV